MHLYHFNKDKGTKTQVSTRSTRQSYGLINEGLLGLGVLYIGDVGLFGQLDEHLVNLVPQGFVLELALHLFILKLQLLITELGALELLEKLSVVIGGRWGLLGSYVKSCFVL